MPARAAKINSGSSTVGAAILKLFGLMRLDRLRPNRECLGRLVQKAQRGNRRAFFALWKTHAPTVQGILLTMVDEADAEALTSEVAVRAQRTLSLLKDGSDFPEWLCGIARDMGLHALLERRGSNGVPRDHGGAPAPTDADRVLAQIRCLPAGYREALILRLLGMSACEIAERTGVPMGSVRLRLFRGMKMLRHRLAAWETESEVVPVFHSCGGSRRRITILRKR